MYITKHAQTRQVQRGISLSMLNYVFENGFDYKDKLIIRKKEALQRLADLRAEERLLKKIIDKGGVVVVAINDEVITTYNYRSH